MTFAPRTSPRRPAPHPKIGSKITLEQALQTMAECVAMDEKYLPIFVQIEQAYHDEKSGQDAKGRALDLARKLQGNAVSGESRQY